MKDESKKGVLCQCQIITFYSKWRQSLTVPDTDIGKAMPAFIGQCDFIVCPSLPSSGIVYFKAN